MTNKRILLVTHEYPPYPGGVGRYCASLAAAAQRLGHDVSVLAPTHGMQASIASPVDPVSRHSGVEVIRFPGDVFRFSEMPSFRRVVEATARAGHYDVLHAADWPALLAVGKLRTTSQRIGTLHGTDILLLKSSWRARMALASQALAAFSTLCCNSAYTQGLLRDHYPTLFPRSKVTYLGVDDTWFTPADLQAKQDFAKRVGFHEDEKLVLTVARLEGRKGQGATIEALGKLPAEVRSKVRYVCVGKEVEPGYAGTLRQAAAVAGIRLVLTGRIPDAELHAAYAMADAFALTGVELPKSVEGFGLVLLEAAAQGLPAVVTSVQAIPEVVVDGRTGWVSSDPAHVSQGFGELFERGRSAMSAACIEHARAFTWERCAHETYGASVS